jgi:small subunit ribosomal protein SAe
MSGGTDVLALKDHDVTKMLSATTHLGSESVNFQMEQYVWKRRSDGVHIINLGRTWEKLLLAARCIASVEHPQEVRKALNYKLQLFMFTLMRLFFTIFRG